MKRVPEFADYRFLRQGCRRQQIEALNANDVPAIRTLLKELVPGYQPDGDVVDWVHMAQASAPMTAVHETRARSLAIPI